MTSLTLLLISIAAGMAVPLALLDAGRAVFGDHHPEQADGFQLERRALPWLLALLVGPALFYERGFERIRTGAMTGRDIGAFAVILIGWAGLYGFLLMRMTGAA